MGDEVVKSVGVIAEPVVTRHEMEEGDLFLVLASDGIWEFVSSQQACELIARELASRELPAQDACKTLIIEAANRWSFEEGDYRDDITATVVRLNPFELCDPRMSYMPNMRDPGLALPTKEEDLTETTPSKVPRHSTNAVRLKEKLSAALLDTSGDSQIDTVGVDTTGDGLADTFYPAFPVSTNHDGCFDSVAVDTSQPRPHSPTHDEDQSKQRSRADLPSRTQHHIQNQAQQQPPLPENARAQNANPVDL